MFSNTKLCHLLTLINCADDRELDTFNQCDCDPDLSDPKSIQSHIQVPQGTICTKFVIA